MKYVLGVDDAGRGPIIGPMVLAGVLIKKEDSQKLKDMGATDSKLLAPRRREILSKQIKETVMKFHSVKMTPLEIDNRESNGLNLNDLEAIKIAEVINSLAYDLQDVEVVVDCPSVNTQAWGAYLRQHIKHLEGKKFIIEHKADMNYPACSAASILAKVERDEEVELIKKTLKIQFGSGYPADPETQKFLEQSGHKYLKFHIIRETWQTWKNVQAKAAQKMLF